MATASYRHAIDPTLVAEAPENGVDDSVARPIPRDKGRSILQRCAGRPALLAGRYRIDQELAEGGMSIVFRAWHVALEQPVAIKMMREELVSHSEAVERFVREAQAMALLRGKHAVRVMDVSSSERGVPFMVLEYLEGRDLRQVLVESGRLPIERAVSLAIQAGTAVAEAHAHGLIHRDLKPDNLFLQTDHDGFELLKVIDYGISKCLNKKSKYETRSEFHLGSPQYMSPEQVCSARSVDARTDVWSLGVVLYELLTGRAPFQGATLPAICSAVLKEDPPNPSTLREDLPEALETIIMRCLAKRRSERFASVERLVDALVNFQGAAMHVSARDRSRATGEPLASHCVLVCDQPPRLAPSHAEPAVEHPAPSSKVRWAGWGVASLVMLSASVSLPVAQPKATPGTGNRASEPAEVPASKVRPVPASLGLVQGSQTSDPTADQNDPAAATSTTSIERSDPVTSPHQTASRSLRRSPSKTHQPRKPNERGARYGPSGNGQHLLSPDTTSALPMSVPPDSNEDEASEMQLEARYALTYQAPGPKRAKSESTASKVPTASSVHSPTGRD